MSPEIEKFINTFAELMIEQNIVTETFRDQVLYVSYDQVPAKFPGNVNYLRQCIKAALKLKSNDVIVLVPFSDSNYNIVKNVLTDEHPNVTFSINTSTELLMKLSMHEAIHTSLPESLIAFINK